MPGEPITSDARLFESESRKESIVPRRAAIGVIAAVVCLVLASPATAGGWWTFIDLDRSRFLTGERVEAATEVWFESVEAAERARASGRFFAYLIPHFNFSVVDRAMNRPYTPTWWRPAGGEPIRVGTVSLGGGDSNLARAHTSIDFGDVVPGVYALMLCDPGCRRPLADVVPARISIFADPMSRTLARRVDAMKARVRALSTRLRHLGRRSAALRSDDDDVQADVAFLRRTVLTLERRLAQRDHVPAAPWSVYAGWFSAGATVAALGAVLLALRKQTRSSRPAPRPEGKRRSAITLRPALRASPGTPPGGPSILPHPAPSRTRASRRDPRGS